MLHFWLEVLSRAIKDTFATIGKDPADVRFSAFLFVLVTVFLLIRNRKKGLRAWVENVKQRFWRIAGEDVAIILGIGFLILTYHMLKEPYLTWDEQHSNYLMATQTTIATGKNLDTCSASLQTEKAKTELLANQVLSQQGIINSQQKTVNATQGSMNTAQSTFDLCVTTLAKASAPIAQSTTMLTIDNSPPNPATKHTMRMALITNKPVTPVKLWFSCDNTIKTAQVSLLGGGVYSGGMTPVSSGSLFVAPKVWQINIWLPVWAPEQPLLLTLDYDEDNLGQCLVRG